MVEVKNLTKSYNNDFSALLNINFKTDFRPTIIVGEEGSGKTTLLNILAGIEKEYEGRVEIDGVERRQIENKDFKISYIMKDLVLFENKSVYANLDYVFKVYYPKASKFERMLKIKQVAEELELFGVLDKKIKKCSLYEKYLVNLGRVMLKQSKLLLIDEPFFNLMSFEIASLWQTMVLKMSKLSCGLIVADTGQNMVYFEGCNIIRLNGGTQIGVNCE